MRRNLLLSIFLFMCLFATGQERELPPDLRQHNLTQYNSSLLDPTFAFQQNKPRSLSLWSRWQWQTIDGDPTSLFINYTQKLARQLSGGVGFLQHNTGVYLNTGVNLNAAYAMELGEGSNLIFGANVFTFGQKLADDQFISSSPTDTIALSSDNFFVTQFSPGLRINANGFSMGMVVENALELNFTDGEMENGPRVFTGMVSNDFPVFLFDQVSYLRPQAYVRAISDSDTQYGLTALFTNPKFWVQGGYNNFYGISGGAGVTLFDKLSLGGLLEFGTGQPASDESSTIEFIISYFFGKQEFEKKEVEEKKTAEERMKEVEERRRLAEAERESRRRERELRKEQARQDSIFLAREAALAAEKEQKRLDSIAGETTMAAEMKQKRLDSIAREATFAAEREQERLDSIARVEREKEVEVRPGEKYEEVVTSDGLEPGFYLIANVFGTKKYFEAFMVKLNEQGLNPKSFYRELNGYNYVYLIRVDTIDEARKARNGKMNGRYQGDLWIFRVRGK